MYIIFQKLRQNRFFINWTSFFSAQMIAQLLGMVASIRIARSLAPAGYGYYHLILTWAVVGNLIATLGMRKVLIREYVRRKNESLHIFIHSLILILIGSILAVVVIRIWTDFSNVAFQNRHLFFITLIIMVNAVWNVAETLAFGHENLKISGVLLVANSMCWCILIWIIPEEYIDVNNVVMLYIAFFCIRALGYLLLNWRFRYYSGHFKLQGFFENSIDILKKSWPFYWLVIMTMFSSRIPIIFLSINSGNAEIGMFKIAERLSSPLKMVMTTAFLALYPKLCALDSYGRNRLGRAVEFCWRGIVLNGGILAMLVILFGKNIILLLFGDDYSLALSALRWMIIYMVFLGIFDLFGTVLAAIGKQKTLARLSTCFALCSVPMLYVGSHYGAGAMATAFVISGVVNMIYHVIVFQRNMPEPLNLGAIFRDTALICLILMAAALGSQWELAKKLILGSILLVAAGVYSRDFWITLYRMIMTRREIS